MVLAFAVLFIAQLGADHCVFRQNFTGLVLEQVCEAIVMYKTCAASYELSVCFR